MAHILVVDDDDIVAELASEILISAGHACAWVSHAGEAWRLLNWRRPDVLLLDEAMPGESGSSFLRRLRGSPGFHDLPVILLTADGDCPASGIGKPLNPTLLLDRVAHLLPTRHTRLAEFQLPHRKDPGPRRVFL